ncbi:hypothetical protein QAD02_015382 [Eretmocerus hayati]|uniref:Uncharacterized protein n=2 Tax=Eretmocerus hayati TaxID=131215 RepID=A0ACC2P852_9HYME|nr:hypothetical protein QAD02_005154 [Eretmocerus hayati]KAJ8679595.1 hypothetical protein QAD02_015382 [Eretmocerus hayati]
MILNSIRRVYFSRSVCQVHHQTLRKCWNVNSIAKARKAYCPEHQLLTPSIETLIGRNYQGIALSLLAFQATTTISVTMVAVAHREELLKAYQCLKLQTAVLRLHLNLAKIRMMKKRLRRWWVRPHITAHQRDTYGGYNRLCRYLKLYDHELFYKNFHMGPQNFDRLHELVEGRLQKQVCVRLPISSEVRLASVLFYLANGGSVNSVCLLFLIGRSTFYKLLAETCAAIKDVLSPLHLRCPSEPAHWLSIAERYITLWDHPYCAGSLDAMHVWIIRPPHGGSLFHNFKGFNSIVLMTLSDADRRVTWYTLGDYGHLSDSSVYAVSALKRKLDNNELGLPAARALPNSDVVVPIVILTDEIFPLGRHTMKPYSRRSLTTRKEKMYNFVHSRNRMPVECQYGNLQKKWEILQQPLGFDLSTTKDVIASIMALHNFLINSNNPNLSTYEPGDLNRVQLDQQLVDGLVRPQEVRERFAAYFALGGPGHLAWAERYIR